ncbi:MAG: glycosyltransferase [Anaerolineales bacterium]|jgi:glycosyltransferase involved in cell wall biosynthesis|nr:glycosyltransferase [Anaerolineales bacterium]
MPFPGRLGLVQRVVPSYRVPFFDGLSAACAGGLSLFAGQPLPLESISVAQKLNLAHLVPAQNLHIFNPQHPFYFCYQRGLPAWLETWDPAALILEANVRYLSSPAAIRWMQKRKRPVIGWGLGAPLSRGLLSGLRRGFLNQFDALVAYSSKGAQEYARLGFPSKRIFVASNAVAAKPTWPLPARPGRFDPQPVVLFVGRLQTRKRIPGLLKACAELPKPLQPRLVIIGEGPERKNLESLAAAIYPAAEFPGPLHGPALAPYFRAADLFVLPGTGGLAVQEAMTYGLPVIVAEGDGTQDDLVRPQNGWQIQPADDFGLLFALQEALSDAARLRKMGAESYRIVSDEINLEKMVGVFLEALAALKVA